MARVDGARKRRRARQIFAATEGLTSAGLKMGLLVFVLTAGYLLYGVLSGGVAEYLKLVLEDRNRLLANVLIASKAAQISAAVVVLCLIIRYYSEDVVGYMFAIAGAAGYFAGPSGFYSILGESGVRGNPLASVILNAFQVVSLILFVPGVGLSVRTLVMTLLEGITGTRPGEEPGIVWGEIEEDKTRRGSGGLNPKCWDMVFCRSFIRQFCPAFRQKKPCWRIKAGCYCDERTILRALKVKDTSAKWDREAQHNKAQHDEISAAAKRYRCRRCAIYSEHQRRKYQLLSPLVFPFVMFVFWSHFGQITMLISRGMESADSFMQFVAFTSSSASPRPEPLLVTSDQTFVFLFVAWLGIITVSYILRGLEYCIFKLQI